MPELFNGFLFLKRKGLYEKVAIADIEVLEVKGDYVVCYSAGREQFIIRISLRKLEDLLLEYNFMRIHRSYLIQLNRIDSINFQEDFVMIGKHQTPMNRNSKKALSHLITKLD